MYLPKILAFGDNRNYFYREAIQAFTNMGCQILSCNISGEISSEQVVTQDTVEQFNPDFVFTINDIRPLLGELSVFLQRYPHVSWLGERPIWPYIWRCTSDVQFRDAIQFVTDRRLEQELKQYGFDQVYFLPLATNPHDFFPKRKCIKSDVSFVGNPMFRQAKLVRKHQIFNCLNSSTAENYKFIKRAAEVIRQGTWDSPLSLLRDLEKELYYVLEKTDETAQKNLERTARFCYIGLYLTGLLRLRCIEQLSCHFRINVYGPGWSNIIPELCRSSRSVDYGVALARIYQGTVVNINISSQHLPTALNSRPFDVPACGAFLLTDYRPGIEELFEVGKEVIVYHNEEELIDKCRYYYSHPEARNVITLRAMERISQEHTYEHRVRQMIIKLSQIGILKSDSPSFHLSSFSKHGNSYG
jgi:spore maturation protein CgeB